MSVVGRGRIGHSDDDVVVVVVVTGMMGLRLRTQPRRLLILLLRTLMSAGDPGFGRVRWVVGRLVMRWEEEALGIGLVRHLHGAGPPRPEDMMTLARVAQDRALRASPAPPQVPGLAQHAAGNSYKGAETRNGSRCLGEYAVAISL